MKKTFALFFTLMLLSSCGVQRKATVAPVSVPTQSEADSLVRALAGTEAPLQTFALETAEGPRVWGFVPAADLGAMAVYTLIPEKGAWVLENRTDYPCDKADGVVFKEFTDSAAVHVFGDQTCLSFAIWAEGDQRGQHSIFLYKPATTSFENLSFIGKKLADGRLEGNSNKNLQLNAGSPEMRWAIATQAANPRLVELSEADLMTDQAIEWWLSKNPTALTRASRISFGQIPAESSLVAKYKTTSKQTASPYSAALFDIRGYTVIVSYNRSSASYSLVWAEPVCRNKNTDRLLNSIYFESGSTLVLFYYKGRTTFKYRLALANGSLKR